MTSYHHIPNPNFQHQKYNNSENLKFQYKQIIAHQIKIYKYTILYLIIYWYYC